MKKFNKTIQIEVEVDLIANNLLSSFKEENAHAPLIVETIIGSMLNSNSLTLLYNSLNGFTNEIDFKIGQEVNCEEEMYSYVRKDPKDAELIQKYVPIGNCIISNIDPYRNNDKVEVKFSTVKSNGILGTPQTKWVNHRKLRTAQIGQSPEAVVEEAPRA